MEQDVMKAWWQKPGVWAVVALALLGGAFYFYGNSGEDLSQAPTTFSGYVARADAENRAVIVRPLFEGPPLTVRITADTRIERALEAVVEGQRPTIEVNITDIEQGERVTLRYDAISNGELVGVRTISLPIHEKYSAEFFAKESNMDVFLRGRVVAFDEGAGTIEFVPLDAASEHPTGVPETVTVSLREGFQVFSISDFTRSPILHARTPSRVESITTNSLISVVFKRSEVEESSLGITSTVLVLDTNTSTL